MLGIALIFAMSISTLATPRSTCEIGEGEICPTIISNQINIAEIKSDVETVLHHVTTQLHKNSEEIKALMILLNKNSTHEEDIADRKVLETCQTEVGDQQSQVKELERQKKEAMQATEEKLNQHEQLRQDIKALRQKKGSTIEKIKCLREEIEKQSMQIADLSTEAHPAMDCADLQIKGETVNGVYTIYPNQTEFSVEVQCDFQTDGGGWTIFFNRVPQPVPMSFDKSWIEFKNGFGDGSAEYWIGNDFLFALTSYDRTSMRIDAKSFTGEERFAVYDNFQVDNEANKYQLTLEGYQTESTLGDSLTVNNKAHFSTSDQDNDDTDGFDCAAGNEYSTIAAGGWWYSACGLSRLAAPLVNTKEFDSALWSNWDPNVESLVSLQAFSLKLRRHNYEELAHVGGKV